MPWLFTPPRRAVALISHDNIRIAIEPGSWSEFTSPTGEDWCAWISNDVQVVRPRHRVRQLVYSDDGEHTDWGFARREMREV